MGVKRAVRSYPDGHGRAWRLFHSAVYTAEL